MNIRKLANLAAKLPIINGQRVQGMRFEDGAIYVSAEDGNGLADFWGEFHGGTPWIHPKLEAWAEKHNGFWEWENPGAIAFYQ